VVILLCIYVLAVWDKPNPHVASTKTALRDSATVAHGEFLFKYSAACWQCHAPNLTVNELPSGGETYDLKDFGPGFGVWRVPNITPDDETGIGKWTDGEVVRAIREGVKKQGRALFIMPALSFHGLSDDDAFALVAYLRSLPPVRNQIPPQEPSFVAKALFAFNLIAAQSPITQPIPAPTKALTAEYGKYLLENRSTCRDCHSIFDLSTGNIFGDSLFVGGNMAIGEPFGQLPEERIDPIWAFGKNLRPERVTGIGNWSEEDFVRAVRTGVRPDSTVLVSLMPYAYYGMWDDMETRAMYAYVKTLQPIARSVPAHIIHSEDLKTGTGAVRGKQLFRAYCKDCHGVDGAGAPRTKLVLAELANTIDDPTLKKFLADGQMNLGMPAFKKTFSSTDIDEVVAYIRTLKK
jgi:mono/diheme cytochrome c family protein